MYLFILSHIPLLFAEFYEFFFLGSGKLETSLNPGALYNALNRLKSVLCYSFEEGSSIAFPDYAF